MSKECRYRSCGIGGLSQEVLNIKLDNKDHSRKTDNLHRKWQNTQLDDENIIYAANDAQISIELFKQFQKEMMPNTSPVNHNKNVQHFIDEHCMCYMKKNKGSNNG